MNTYLYRVLESDDEGDPLDFGCLRAKDEGSAWRMVRRRLGDIFDDGEEFPVRLYPMAEVEEGVFLDGGDFVDKLVTSAIDD